MTHSIARFYVIFVYPSSFHIMSSPEGAQNTPPSGTSHNNNLVNLRVTYLHAGNPRPPHNLGLVAADTTIAALKARLQTELLETPAAEEQRLIYQGRPLLHDGMTLKEALRIDGPIGPLPYTLHIVIQPRHAASHFRPQQTANPPEARTTGATNAWSVQQQMAQQVQQLQEMNRVQAMAQAQLHMMQQQLNHFGQQPGAVQTTQQHIPGHHTHHFSATFINGQPVLPATQNGPQTQSMPQIGSLATQFHNAQRMAGQTGPQTQPASTHGTVPPQLVAAQNGPQIQHPPDNGTTATRSQSGTPAAARPPQAAGPQQPAGGGVHHPLLQNLGQPQVQHLPRPLSVPPQPRAGEQRGVHLFPHPPDLGVPIPPLSQIGLPFPPIQAQFSQIPLTSQATVWLASSRSGPEAVLFAPGHGFFSSNQSRRSDQVRQVQEVINARNPAASRSTPAVQAVDAQRTAARAAIPPATGQVALRQPAQPDAAEARRRARRREREQDWMGHVVQRGWLFLRLYMFIYVLSEPNTWRRWIMLFLAVFICLLPRRNPVVRLLRRARRHVDNLIGPPRPDRHRAAAAGQPAAPGGTPAPAVGTQPRQSAVGTGAATTTPEEAAARIIRERRQQQEAQRAANPNVLRDLLYRSEQAVALFLASLVPGVGERHVAAREEQRRQEMQAEVARIGLERAEDEASARTRALVREVDEMHAARDNADASNSDNAANASQAASTPTPTIIEPQATTPAEPSKQLGTAASRSEPPVASIVGALPSASTTGATTDSADSGDSTQLRARQTGPREQTAEE